ncbi:MAG: FlgD immunoglobulin-like domain containing protein, partial [Candidatus Gracilibacteria bacterium]|nr:FlgD immunoglobulin-like domain containing protein [Candidatus Gracilibacteria bacterium]
MKSIVKTIIFALSFVWIFAFPSQTSASLSMAVSNVYATPSTVDFSTRPSVAINYYTNTEGYVTLEIFKGSDKVGTFVENQFVGIGNHAYYWNGKYGSGAEIGGAGQSVEGGTYTFKIDATGTNQTKDLKEGTIKVSAPANPVTSETGVSITESSADKDSFDPWKSQNIKINFEIDSDAKVTIKILNQNGGLIKTLASSKSYSTGSHSITWNGKNTSGSIVEEGDYKYTINAAAGLHQDDDQGEFSVQKGAVVTAGTKVPDIEGVYVTKEDFDPDWEYTHIVFNLTAQADLKISIYKNNDLIETLYDEKNQKSGLYKIMWEGNKNTGNYTYKIEAENSKGKDLYTEDMKISEEKADEKNAPNIYKDQIDIDVLPYSAKKGALKIYFKLDKDADEVTVEIRKGGKTIKTIMDDEELEKGSHSVDWDGKNKSGLSVAGGVYEYRITAKKSSKKDVERGYFSVGTSASTGGQSGKCAGFADVLASYAFCDAIAWAKDTGIFVGYPDGSFKPYQPIRRS